MTKLPNIMVSTKIKRVFNLTASVLLIAVMTLVAVFCYGENSYAVSDDQGETWAITVGDAQVLYVDSQESGLQVIEGLKSYYLTNGSKVIDVQFSPEITVTKVKNTSNENLLSAKSAVVTGVEDAVETLSEGKILYYVYFAQEGDTFQSLAKENGLSAKKLKTLNFDEYDVDETIKEGTYVVLYKVVPYVQVKTVEEVTSNTSIDYETVFKKTSSLNKGQYKVITKGQKGNKQSVKQVTKLNGETVTTKVLSTDVTKDPVNKVVLKGTDSVTAKSGVTFDFVSGEDVVDYAKEFIGNPYRYGGSSLTNGSDCSGFVYSVYKHFGIDLPRSGQIGVGKSVSYSNVRKGDILFYPGHVAIYAGNGKAVHAVNERLGIRVTSVNYTGSVYAVRRIVD